MWLWGILLPSVARLLFFRDNLITLCEPCHAEVHNPERRVAVVQCSVDGTELRTFGSVTEASRETGITIPMISAIMNGKTGSRKFLWKRNPVLITPLPKRKKVKK
jgi:hypothetical protein